MISTAIKDIDTVTDSCGDQLAISCTSNPNDPQGRVYLEFKPGLEDFSFRRPDAIALIAALQRAVDHISTADEDDT